MKYRIVIASVSPKYNDVKPYVLYAVQRKRGLFHFWENTGWPFRSSIEQAKADLPFIKGTDALGILPGQVVWTEGAS